MAIVGSHQQAAFTIPVNGTSPVDANEVRLNDNATVTQHNAHDADATIHVQSSALASRPTAGTVGRVWATTDTGEYRWWYDDGSLWHEMGADHVNFPVKANETLAKGDVVKAVGFNIGLGVTVVAKVSGVSDVALGVARDAIPNGSTGYVTNTGTIRNINTVAFPIGTILYPNTSGGFMSSKPATGLYQALAIVLRSHATNGVLLVEASEPQYVQSAADAPNTAVIRNSSGNFAANEITAITRFIGPLTGAVTGNADTATALSTTRTFALTGDVTGSAASDLASGVSIATAITTVPVAKGGTGVTAAPTNGQLLIGNGTGYTLGTITAGNNISVTNAAGSITLDVTASGSAVTGTATGGTVPRMSGTGVSSTITTGTLQDDGTNVGAGGAPNAGAKLTVHGALQVTGSVSSVNGVTYTWPSTQGAASTVLQNNGSGTLSWGSASEPIDVQTFNTSGTWTKPSAGSMALLECWGAGGSGGRHNANAGNVSGGGGGGYNFRFVPLSSLGATEVVTVGAGGAARTTNAAGIAGGDSSVGSACTGYGGAGGANDSSVERVAMGGSVMRAGTVEAVTVLTTAFTVDQMDRYDKLYAGGGSVNDPNGTYTATNRHQNSVYGGGAGRSLANNVPAGASGTSVYAGNGGGTGTAGTAPAGGGGASTTTSGAGAAGRVRITVW